MLIVIVTALYGLIIGSALNAIAWRIHEHKSWSRGRSMCPDCGHELAMIDLVPVVSWLLLRGKCRYCRKAISVQYPAVELLTAALFGLSAAALAPGTVQTWVLFVAWLFATCGFIVLAVYDLRWMILPDRVIVPGIGLAAARLIFLAATGSATQAWLGPLEAAAIAGGFFFFLASLADGKFMGWGDVKLVFLMGLLLGVKGTLLALFLGFNSAAIVSVILIAAKIRKRRDVIPFGPFLIAGTIIAYLYGETIVHWYLHLNGLT